MESGLTMHLMERFELKASRAAAYASLFGLMNIFSRGLGGFISDKMQQTWSLRGRLLIHMVFMTVEGILIFVFIHSKTLTGSLVTMILFAIFGQVHLFCDSLL